MLFPTPTGYQFSLIENAAAVAVAFTDCNLEYLLIILATLVVLLVVVYIVALVLLVVVIDSSGESSSASSLFTLSKCSSRSID